MEPNFNDIAAKLGFGGAILFALYWGLAKALPGFLQTWQQARLAAASTDASVITANASAAAAKAVVDQIEGLTARMSATEKNYAAVIAQLEEERHLRFEAEAEVERLQRRVAALEDQIKRMGGTPA